MSQAQHLTNLRKVLKSSDCAGELLNVVHNVYHLEKYRNVSLKVTLKYLECRNLHLQFDNKINEAFSICSANFTTIYKYLTSRYYFSKTSGCEEMITWLGLIHHELDYRKELLLSQYKKDLISMTDFVNALADTAPHKINIYEIENINKPVVD